GVLDARDPLLSRMVEVHDREQVTVVALMEVPKESIHLYGCAAVAPTEDEDVVRITALVEKPDASEAPSNLAVIGRYVLRPEIFGLIDKLEPGRGGEYQLTDALNVLAAGRGDRPVYGVVFKGRRYDTGDRADWIKANLLLGVDHDELGAELTEWVLEFAEQLRAGTAGA
ncbi:MAG: UTP--glucose-1-phosphate uridylyltransferase, partial [Actinobacteria bacterium]|nr:UTP--glucose-1-phosphate uridylyltransferase [Actinomycetota bacterium]